MTALALAGPACRRLSAAYAAGMPEALARVASGDLQDLAATRPA